MDFNLRIWIRERITSRKVCVQSESSRAAQRQDEECSRRVEEERTLGHFTSLRGTKSLNCLLIETIRHGVEKNLTENQRPKRLTYERIRIEVEQLETATVPIDLYHVGKATHIIDSLGFLNKEIEFKKF